MTHHLDTRHLRRRKFLRVLTWGSVLLTGVVCLAVAWAYVQWKSEPVYWQANKHFLAKTPPAKVERLAQEAENILINAMSTRGPASRHLRFSMNQINAWLARRLPAWLANQGKSLPPGISHLMVHSEQGQLVAAFEYQRGQHHQIVSLVFDAMILPDGHMLVHLVKLRGGNLPVQARWVSGNLSPASELSQMLEPWTQGKQFMPIFDHPADRHQRLRVVGLMVHTGGVMLDVLQERKP